MDGWVDDREGMEKGREKGGILITEQKRNICIN